MDLGICRKFQGTFSHVNLGKKIREFLLQFDVMVAIYSMSNGGRRSCVVCWEGGL
jgi:hypothetical protein